MVSGSKRVILIGISSCAATVQWIGRSPDCIAFSSYHVSGRKRKILGLWKQSPRKLDDYYAEGPLMIVKTNLV